VLFYLQASIHTRILLPKFFSDEMQRGKEMEEAITLSSANESTVCRRTVVRRICGAVAQTPIRGHFFSIVTRFDCRESLVYYSTPSGRGAVVSCALQMQRMEFTSENRLVTVAAG
jgi:hypothetical protein